MIRWIDLVLLSIQKHKLNQYKLSSEMKILTIWKEISNKIILNFQVDLKWLSFLASAWGQIHAGMCNVDRSYEERRVRNLGRRDHLNIWLYTFFISNIH